MLFSSSVCTQQMYTIVLEIQSSLLSPDIRWAHFQMPVKVEDALGRIFPVPSEYCLADLRNIIQHRFKEGPGHLQVAAGDYELFNTKNSKQNFNSRSHLALLPGQTITMAILIVQMIASDEICPMPKCQSEKTRAVAGGGRCWYALTSSSVYLSLPQNSCAYYKSTLVASVTFGSKNRRGSENESRLHRKNSVMRSVVRQAVQIIAR